MASGIAESKADMEVIQRQAQTVQTALKELMRSTRNEAVIESVRLPDLVTQTLEIVPDACRQRLTVDAGRIAAARSAQCESRARCCAWCCRT